MCQLVALAVFFRMRQTTDILSIWDGSRNLNHLEYYYSLWLSEPGSTGTVLDNLSTADVTTAATSTTKATSSSASTASTETKDSAKWSQLKAALTPSQKLEWEQTGRVILPAPARVGKTKPKVINPQKVIKPWKPPSPQPNITFLQDEDLHEADRFSASWFQRVSTFMTMPLEEIHTCEDASFVATKWQPDQPRNQWLRMTSDYLDYSIEHLSKWWVQLSVNVYPQHRDAAMSKLQSYLEQASTYPIATSTTSSRTTMMEVTTTTNQDDTGTRPAVVFEHAIALIAFRSYGTQYHNDGDDEMAVLSLAATLESLRRAGFGRVVVVGMNAVVDRPLVQQAFRILAQQVQGTDDNHSGDIHQIGHMQVTYQQGSPHDAKTSALDQNIPLAALKGFKKALLIAQMIRDSGKRGTPQLVRYMRSWLGSIGNRAGQNPLEYWKYVYLTEPDSILVTRPSTLNQLKEELDQGHILVPHRLLPIAHESDVPSSNQTRLFVPAKGAFERVLELDGLGSSSGGAGSRKGGEVVPDVCCDEFKGPDFRPGQEPFYPDCGNCKYFFLRLVLNQNTDTVTQTAEYCTYTIYTAFIPYT